MTEARPTLSVGIPVRNEEAGIAGTVRSVLAQQDVDLEVIVADNASTDRTPEICRDLAAEDPRFRYHYFDQDVGSLANFNRTFDMSRGRYFRWLGGGDRLRPGYARACVDHLDATPDDVLVTTRFEFALPDGGSLEAGAVVGPTGSDPVSRLSQMLMILGTGYRNIDPMYSMMRRSVLARTGLVRPLRLSDQLLATELSLLGPFGHIPEYLAIREHPRFLRVADATRIYQIPQYQSRLALVGLCQGMLRIVNETDLPPQSAAAARRLITAHYLRRHSYIVRRRFARLRKSATPSQRKRSVHTPS